ncbi:MAG TPA: hypothetical protein VFC21_08810, partial [Bryobacteraceae bacterium]|nr:hypothetical protein [Bryobacteraceae bacterium]
MASRACLMNGVPFALLGLSCLFSASVKAQQDRAAEVGYPYIRNFGPADFNAPEATWGTIQDNRGIIYVGNQIGALEYDGVSWRLIATPKKTYIRTFAKDNTGRIYAGSSGDFGYLAPDKNGRMAFVSLLDKVPKEDRDFTDIWSTIATPQGIYFLAHNRLFRYVNDRTPIRAWTPAVRFVFASYVRGQLYVGDAMTGLLHLESDRLQPVPGFERFRDSRRLVLMPYGDDRILVADRGPDNPQARFDSPLFLYDGSKLTPFKSEADKLLIGHRLTIGVALKDGTFVFGTTGEGVVILNRDGRMLWHITQSAGLLDDTVYALYPDDDGLWVNLAEGLARVELPPPVSYFKSGIEGAKLSFVRHNGSLYIGTTGGVYRLDASGGKPHFIVIGGTANFQAPAMVSVQDGGQSRLILGSSSGLFEIEGDKAIPMIPHSGKRPYAVTCLVVSRRDPSRIYVGLDDGLASIRLTGGKPADENKFKNVPVGKRVQRMVEESDGHIWLGTEANGVLRVDAAQLGPDGVPDRDAPVREFDRAGGEGINVFELGGMLLFASNDLTRLYRLNESTGKITDLAKGNPLASASSDPKLRGFGFQEDSHGNVWTYRGRNIVFLKKNGNTYTPTPQPFAHSD